MRSLRLLLLSQVGLVLFLGAVVLLGDRSAPGVSLATERIGVTDAVVLHFDRPVKRTSLEENFRLDVAEPVAGTFQWSPRSVAFLPTKPLRHGASYTLVLRDLEDEQGHHLREPFTRTIWTSPPRFLYLTPERSLGLYLVDERRSVAVSRDGESVLDFAVSPDGTRLFVSYATAGDVARFGLYVVRLDRQQAVSHRRELRQGDRRRVFRLLLCDAGSIALVYQDEVVEGVPAQNKTLLAVPVYEDRLAFDQGRVILPTEAIEPILGFSATLACSPRSDRFLYGDAQRQIILGSLYDPTAAAPLGFPSQVYGFSPGDRILLGARTDAPGFSLTKLLMVDPETGAQTVLGDPAADVFDPSLTADEAWLAVAEGRPEAGSGAYTAAIGLYGAEGGLGQQQQQRLSSPPSGSWDAQPAWSIDGRFLAFVRQLRGSEPTAAPNGQGRSLEGSVHVVSLTGGNGTGLETTPPVELGIVGGQIVWLP